MNLWIFNQFAASGKYSTGAGERHFYLAQEYIHHSVDTTIFSGSYNHLFHSYPKFNGRGKIDFDNGVRFFWVKVPFYSPNSAFGRLKSWFWFVINLFLVDKSQIPKPDVIVVSSMSMFPILNAILYRIQYSNVKIIFEVRDIWPKTLLEMSNLSKFHPMIVFMSFVERVAYKKSNMIISVLPNAKQHIEGVAGKSVDFKWIPNGINSRTITISSLPKEAKGLFPKNKFVITYAGALGPANAMEYFAEAIETLNNTSDYHINIIGEGPSKLELQARLRKFDFVHFVGRIKKNMVYSYLIKSDLLYIGWRNKSIYDFGVSANKYNDYMLAAKPILSSSSFSDDPVAEANCGKIVPAESAQAIKLGIENMFGLSREELAIMGERGLKFVQQNRDYKVLADQYFKSISSLIV